MNAEDLVLNFKKGMANLSKTERRRAIESVRDVIRAAAFDDAAGSAYEIERCPRCGVSVNIIFTISTNAFSPIAPTRIRRIRQRGCAAFGA